MTIQTIDFESAKQQYENEYMDKTRDALAEQLLNILIEEVNGMLNQENNPFTLDEACETLIEDRYWSDFEIMLLVHTFHKEYRRAGNYMAYFLKDFKKFLYKKVPWILGGMWEKRYRPDLIEN